MCITDLELILGYTQAKTSRHIGYLKNAGLISPRKEDQWVFYQIKEEVLPFLDQVYPFMAKDNSLQQDADTYDILNSNRELSKNKLEQKAYLQNQGFRPVQNSIDEK